MMPNYLTSAERGAYSRGFDRAARAYLKANGSPSVSAATAGEWTAEDARKLREHSTSWHATHDATRASKCHAGGMSAVRKLHSDIVKRAAKYAALEITSADHLATLTAQADIASARLAELVTLEGGKVRKPATRRKAPARKLASVPDVAAVETVAPAEVAPAEVDNSPAAVESRRAMFAGLGWQTSAPAGETSTPETVPDPLPAMTRAARKATRRELAATMRAAGIRPEGQAWRDACAAAGLPVRDEVNA